MKFIIGKKIGMTTIYEKGESLNVSLVACDKNEVALIRTPEKDGYAAVQVKVQKTKKTFYKKEFRIDDISAFKVGQEISLADFQTGEKVNISGVTKAKGFQGGMKRHGFSGSPQTHGHKHDHRAPGSIGSQAPQRVFKGLRMAGRMGGKRLTVRNLQLVYLDKENSILGLRGAVPGVAGRLVEIVVS